MTNFKVGDVIEPKDPDDAVRFPRWVGLTILEFNSRTSAKVIAKDGSIFRDFNLHPHHGSEFVLVKSNMKKYNIEYILNCALKEELVEADNIPEALVEFGKHLLIPETVKIISVAPEKYATRCLQLGGEYTTVGGLKVKMMNIHNAGRDFETMSDQFGVHRYSRNAGHIIGRCTASAINDQMNIIIEPCWYNPDFDHDTKYPNVTVHRSSDERVVNYVDISGDGNHVCMDYRNYSIERKGDVWSYYDAVTDSYIVVKSKYEAMIWIDIKLSKTAEEVKRNMERLDDRDD